MPKPPKDDKRGVSKSSLPEDQRTRAKRIIDRGGTPLFPSVDESEYLLGYMQELDWVRSTAMGREAIDEDKVLRWAEGAGYELTPWEFSTLLAMSRAYLSQSIISEQPECPPPYGSPVNEFDRDVVASKVASLFGSRVTKKAPT